MVTVAMGPRGLACAVLATIPLQRGVEGGLWLQDTLFAMIPISIILTSIFVISSESPEVSKFFNRFFEGYRDKDLIEAESTNPLPES